MLDGNVNFTGTVFGSQASYSCLYGYNITGDITRICLADGTWSGSVPFCERKLLCLHTASVYILHNYSIINVWVDRRREEKWKTNRWMDGWMDGWVGGWTNELDGWVGGWVDGLMNWMGG